MESTLDYILKKFNLTGTERSPIEIPNYGRDNLAELFKELGFKVGVEVGVQEGKYSKILLDANPGVELYGVDPYVPYRWYRDFTRSATIGGHKTEAYALLGGYDNYHFIEKMSADAVNDFKDNSLDFVYLDGNHEFMHVAVDISLWQKKLRKGGILAGHDYIKRPMPTATHVLQVVNAYTDSYEVKPWFVLGRKANDEGLIRDKERSWMWVKP